MGTNRFPLAPSARASWGSRRRGGGAGAGLGQDQPQARPGHSAQGPSGLGLLASTATHLPRALPLIRLSARNKRGASCVLVPSRETRKLLCLLSQVPGSGLTVWSKMRPSRSFRQEARAKLLVTPVTVGGAQASLAGGTSSSLLSSPRTGHPPHWSPAGQAWCGFPAPSKGAARHGRRLTCLPAP